MNDKTKTVAMTDESTIEKKIENIVFDTLKHKIRGRIYVKMKEKVDKNDNDKLFIKVLSNNIVYTEELQLMGETLTMVSQNEEFAKTLANIIFDNFKKYIESKFFVQDRPKRYSDKS